MLKRCSSKEILAQKESKSQSANSQQTLPRPRLKSQVHAQVSLSNSQQSHSWQEASHRLRTHSSLRLSSQPYISPPWRSRTFHASVRISTKKTIKRQPTTHQASKACRNTFSSSSIQAQSSFNNSMQARIATR